LKGTSRGGLTVSRQAGRSVIGYSKSIHRVINMQNLKHD